MVIQKSCKCFVWLDVMFGMIMFFNPLCLFFLYREDGPYDYC